MFQIWQGIPGINPKHFPVSTWERDHFFVFSTFQTLDYKISKNIQANPCEFVRESKKMRQVSLKYMESNASFFSFLQNVAF